MHLIVLLAFILGAANKAFADYFTANVGLGNLLLSESRMVENLELFIVTMELRANQMSQTLDEIELMLNKTLNSPEEPLNNPIYGFTYLLHIVKDWTRLHAQANQDIDYLAFSSANTELATTGVQSATKEDIDGAAKGVARLQNTYLLRTDELANGLLLGRQSQARTTSSDCFVLGEALYRAQHYREAVEWLLQARIKLQQEKRAYNGLVRFPYLEDVHILEYLSPALFSAGNYKMAAYYNAKLLSVEQDNPYGLTNRDLYQAKLREETRFYADNYAYLQEAQPKPAWMDLYAKVCRGEVKQSPAAQRPLRCRYTHNNIPYYRIGPFKIEMLSVDPFVAFYHEAIHDSEIDRIISIAQGTVQRSKVGDLDYSHYSDVRTSQNTWLDYETHSFLAPLKQRLKDITGLSLASAEPLQVANYGIGGHYGPHHDFSENDDAYGEIGNRIVTALFYINHVELGGATAFPYLHLAVPPIRRSLVVWNNLHESLERDYRTKHAGCPVLKGSKWICNEWFHVRDQEFLRPCSLQQNGNVSLAFRDHF